MNTNNNNNATGNNAPNAGTGNANPGVPYTPNVNAQGTGGGSTFNATGGGSTFNTPPPPPPPPPGGGAQGTNNNQGGVTPGRSDGYTPSPFAVPNVGGVKDMVEGPTPYIGGMPTPDFSAQADPTAIPTTEQFRAQSIKTEGAAQKLRVSGLPKSTIKPGVDIKILCQQLLEKVENNGNDSAFYIPDKNDASKMVNFLNEFSMYTLEDIKRIMAHQVTLYDSYLKKSDKENKLMIMSTCDSNFETLIRRRCTYDKVSCVQLMMVIISELTSTAFDRYSGYKDSIRAATCDQLFGVKIHQRNMQDVCDIFKEKFEDLERANQLEVKLLEYPLAIAISALGDLNDHHAVKHREPLSHMLIKVDAAIKATCSMPNIQDQWDHFRDNGIFYEDVLSLIEKQYRAMIDSKSWPAASNPVDSQRPAPSVNALQSNLMSQNGGGYNSSNRHSGNGGGSGGGSGRGGRPSGPSAQHPCRICGSHDHWGDECPQNSNRGGGGGGNDNNRYRILARHGIWEASKIYEFVVGFAVAMIVDGVDDEAMSEVVDDESLFVSFCLLLLLPRTRSLCRFTKAEQWQGKRER